MKAPELLLPAGGLERMRTAYDYGADAVYAGSPRYSLRARNNEFAKLDVLEQGIKEAHERNKKFFLTVNTLPHNSKLKTFVSDMEPLIAMKPDALIMADPGLIMTVREKWPEMPIHLSVQANTTNYWGVKFWQNIGVERIILSRELSMEEIAEIRQQCPDIELEVFIHGALCIAYSGRCLLSGYFNHRDPNQGTFPTPAVGTTKSTTLRKTMRAMPSFCKVLTLKKPKKKPTKTLKASTVKNAIPTPTKFS
ncbi:protease [Neisseria meningitidis]|nr:protease [Neisseria meningitidis]